MFVAGRVDGRSGLPRKHGRRKLLSRSDPLFDRLDDRLELLLATEGLEIGVRGDQRIGETELDRPVEASDGRGTITRERPVAGQIVVTPAARGERLRVCCRRASFRLPSRSLENDRVIGARFLPLAQFARAVEREHRLVESIGAGIDEAQPLKVPPRRRLQYQRWTRTRWVQDRGRILPARAAPDRSLRASTREYSERAWSGCPDDR